MNKIKSLFIALALVASIGAGGCAHDTVGYHKDDRDSIEAPLKLNLNDTTIKQGPRPPEFPPLRNAFEACTEGCVTTFKATATRILIDETLAFRIQDMFRQQLALARIYQRKQLAKSVLYECLSRCFRTYRPPFGVTLGSYYSAIVAEFLERPE